MTSLRPDHSDPPFEFDFPAHIESLLNKHVPTLTPEQMVAIIQAVVAAQGKLLGAAVNHRHSQELCALTKVLVDFCAAPAVDDPALKADCFLCFSEQDSGSEAAACGPEPRGDEEYLRGYRAFFDYRRFGFRASSSWRDGWEAADMELDGQTIDSKALNQLPPPLMYGAFGPGDLARDLELPFDEFMTDEWKAAWERRDAEISSGNFVLSRLAESARLGEDGSAHNQPVG